MHSGGKLILFADADGATKFSDIEKLEKALMRMSRGLDETFPGVAVGSRFVNLNTMLKRVFHASSP